MICFVVAAAPLAKVVVRPRWWQPYRPVCRPGGRFGIVTIERAFRDSLFSEAGARI
jgi:hypothetical protein